MGNSVKPISNEKTEASVYGMDDSPRGKLLSAAARLFRDQGFERTTVRDIAREVGLQSGSIFPQFATKEDILHAVMEEVIAFNTARLREALVGLTCHTEKLRALVRDRKSTRLNSSHVSISYAVFCLKKKIII